MGPIAGAIVGLDASDLDAKAFVIGDRGLQEVAGADRLLIGLDLGEGDARGVVAADMAELPADAPAVALASAVAGDAVAHVLKTPKFLDVDMDQLAGLFPLVALHRLGGL
jgi:ApbE superfamily uncharacterized protein (UPF0280 family)